VAARGEHPVAEIWSIAAAAQTLVHQQALVPDSDGEDLRVAWSNGRWSLGTGDAPTVAGLPATLEATAPAAGPGRTNPASASSGPEWARWAGLGAVVAFAGILFRHLLRSRGQSS